MASISGSKKGSRTVRTVRKKTAASSKGTKSSKKGYNKGRATKGQIFFVVFLALITVALAIYWCVESESFNIASNNKLQLHFIDVGQGDCTLIITPEGESMLIDSGKDSESEKVISYISKLGIKTLDYMVISHFHDDHYGSCDEVAEEIGVDVVITNGAPADNNTEKELMQTFERQGCEIMTADAGFELTLGELELYVLGPTQISDGGGNNDSLVIKLTYRASSFLFTGDAEILEEEAILDMYTPNSLSCDLIKVGHHGSNTSSSDDFLDAVDPSIALISVGEGNSYGHPHKSVIDSYNERDVEVYRTDRLGDVVILCDGENIMLYQEKSGPIERFLETIGIG